MSRRCDLTDTGVQVGFNVSHSNRHTKRRFLPNLQQVSLSSEGLKRDVSLRITAATLRSIDHNGGLDAFLLTTSDNRLSAWARKLKKQIRKNLGAEAVAKLTGKAESKPAKKPAAAKKATKKSAKA